MLVFLTLCSLFQELLGLAWIYATLYIWLDSISATVLLCKTILKSLLCDLLSQLCN